MEPEWQNGATQTYFSIRRLLLESVQSFCSEHEAIADFAFVWPLFFCQIFSIDGDQVFDRGQHSDHIDRLSKPTARKLVSFFPVVSLLVLDLEQVVEEVGSDRPKLVQYLRINTPLVGFRLRC